MNTPISPGEYGSDKLENMMNSFQLEEFLELDTAPLGQSQISYGGIPIHIELEAQPDQPLIVCFHGAKIKRIELSWLVGKNMISSLPASRLSISDPSLQLNNDLTLSWYIGNSSQPHLQQVLDKIVQKIGTLLNATRTVFFGGSGGGFAALRATHSNPGSVGVCFNPQTSIEQYHRGHLERFHNYCWENDTDLIPESTITSVVEQYKKEEFHGKIIYFQNNTDIHHTVRHLPRFLEASAGKGEIYLGISNWSDKHSPPPQQALRAALVLAMYDAPYKSIKELGFIRQ